MTLGNLTTIGFPRQIQICCKFFPCCVCSSPRERAEQRSSEHTAIANARTNSFSDLQRSICVSLLVSGRPQAFTDFFSLPWEELESIEVEGESKYIRYENLKFVRSNEDAQ